MWKPVGRSRGDRKQFNMSRTEYLEARQLLDGVQDITPNPVSQIASGAVASIVVDYSTSDSDATLTGLGLRVHFDSTKLAWSAPTGVLGTPMVLGSPVDDTSNYDGDAATDKYVLVAWGDMTGNWPGTALPASLMTLNFGTVSGFTGTTNVRFSASSASAGYTFSSTPAAITATATVPSLSINDVSVTEGSSGTINAVFTVTLSASSAQMVTVDYTTADNTATLANNDYQVRSGTLTFNPGVTSQTITVPVVGDTAAEANETFYVNLGSPSNATISDSQGVGTVMNDDSAVLSQTITPENGNVVVPVGSPASIVVDYSTSDSDATLTGLGLRVHFDSTKLAWSAPTGVLGTPMVLGSPVDDTSNYDGDAATDKYVLVAWGDMTGNWPGTALPASLMTLNFGTVSGFTGTTNVRFSASSASAGYTFSSTPAAISTSDENDPPTGVALSNASIAENQPSGTVVGVISTTDPDAGDTFAYSLVGGIGSTDNASFTINGNQLKTAASFDFETKSSYSIRVRTMDQGGLTYEKAFAVTVTNVNDVPTNLVLSAATIGENQPVGTSVGILSTTDPDMGNTFTYALVAGVGGADNSSFTISGNQLKTAARFDYEARTSYSIRVRTTDSGGLSYEKALTITVTDDPTDFRGQFGIINGKMAASPANVDADGDLVTFKVTGGGTGNVYGYGNSFEDIVLAGTTAKSVLTISVKKNKAGGDGIVRIGNISSDGLLKSINASTAMLSGLVQVNMLNQGAGKAAISMKFRQISDSDVRIQSLPVSSIAVGGDVSSSRIIVNDSIKKFSAATLLDSDILVGVASDFAGQCAGSAGDFANPSAKLGSLAVAGKKLPKGSSYPASVEDVHISAPSVGTAKMANVSSTAGSVQVYVLADTGTLTITALNPVMGGVSVLTAGSWKAGKVGRPEIFSVV